MIIICGPTAVGKTAHAIDLALKEGAEIISADSGQVYRGLDIGTAKPTPKERGKVPFHLIDLIDPSEQFNAADFRRFALQKIEEIQSRGKKVIIAGGTGLYIKVLEEGIFDGPAADPKTRSALEKRVEQEGIESLHRELQRVDPVAATKIPSRNRQRIIRALEVYELTGKPISAFWKEGRGAAGCAPTLKIGLTLPREELNRRIDERIDRMIAAGWIEET
ncbi:MAG: tRNA (adenosine(37)-N6)-dimethylallyltransferase MiaA, partial [Deltaproteobacteria bacterium]|nr:tRNA (adenosine(37)-N6)-dimethylallyltransferase MiaA [Deltaproteobacteria bacterium]